MAGRKGKTVIVLLLLVAAGISVLRLRRFFVSPPRVTLKGAVLVRNADVDKQAPIADVEISVAGGLASQIAQSNPNGYFALTLGENVKPGQPIILRFRHPEYQPLDLTLLAGGRLEVASMVPLIESSSTPPAPPPAIISDVRIKYLTRTTTLVNVGSVVKTFRVVNAANVPCRGHYPCSPDGKWKATIGSTTLDAPDGNVFARGRVSCIAGPCPFTKIRSDEFSRGGPTLRVAVLNWLSTTTFLVEAEVFRLMSGDSVNYSYPVIFGQTLHFTAPADAEGLCIEAEINNQPIVFPFGPEPILSWASCTESVSPNHTALYQCELKPGYGLKQ